MAVTARSQHHASPGGSAPTTQYSDMGASAAKGVPALQLWSGGKDSAMALWTARHGGEVDVQALASTIAPKVERTTWHGVRIAERGGP